MTERDVAHLKITLNWVEPKVVRRVEVPLDLRLDRLHQTIQAAMGWTDSHLWGFEVGDLHYGPPMPDFGFGEAPVNASKVTLQKVLADAGATDFLYIYDYGDSWEHVIEVETLGKADADRLVPRLVEAEGACPPEDIGGPPGYLEFLDAMGDPQHERHDELLEWHGGPFDPADVDHEGSDAQLRQLAKRWNRKPPARKAKPA
jgi:hypothetical protein